MKPRQRQAAILEHLQKQGKCSVEELAQYFDTTGTTIRKDLVILENAFEQFSFDKLFMGTDGIDLNVGVTTFNEVYTVSNAMCNAAREVILMADSSKFGRKSPNVVCSLETVDKLITDAGIDPAFRQALEAKGIEVIITGESNE